MTKTNVYLFSGIIRDYFINSKNSFRDVDFIVDDIDVEAFISDFDTTKNNYGGYKITIGSVTIDLWNIKNTWGLPYQSLLPFAEYMPETTFFNSSSILYSLNNKQFIVGKPFLDFLKNKQLDIVLENNSLPALCIVNSFYYSQKYKVKFSNRLSQYILDNYEAYSKEFESIQKKHFKKVLYPENELLKLIHTI
ncbi:hypothetical protein SAMD00024442_15_27 [Candidatus Symbiothrix dinenymphae]|nr:hypothetical protein SAMD00024442_15_27 [Candidatus Symbiothrix dinenymphae]